MTREEDMKTKAASDVEAAETPMDKLRCLLLANGYDGILQFGKLFRVTDSEITGTVSTDELPQIVHNSGIELNDLEISDIFTSYDQDGSGRIDYENFMGALRPNMNDTRLDILNEAFSSMADSDTDSVSLDVMREKYDTSLHPKVTAGMATEEEMREKFIARFEGGIHEEGKVTRQEFLDYYSTVSKSIDDDDEYFVEVIKLSWRM